MSSDLIAGIVAVTLGIAVVVIGLRRNLSETTRNGLPRYGADPEPPTATLGLYEGEERRRRPLSPRQRRWLVSLYSLIALTNAAFAIVSADDRVLHASTAGMWALAVVILLWQGSSRLGGSAARQRVRGF